jgi:hypothetical protein
METKNTPGLIERLEGMGFSRETIKKYLALLVRNKEFYEEYGCRFKPYDFATIDPEAPHEAMEQNFAKADEFYKQSGNLITKDALKNSIDMHFRRFSKDEKDKAKWYELVDEIFDMKDLDVEKDYYASQLPDFLAFQDFKLSSGKAFEKFDRPLPLGEIKEVIRKHIDECIKITQIGEPAQVVPATQPVAFPKDAIQGFLKEFADLYSSHLESPYEFWMFNAATCLGNMFSNKVRLNNSLYTQPRLFTIDLGTSGDARKSSSGRLTIDFIDEIMPDDGEGKKIKLFNALWGCGSAEGLLRKLETTPRLVLVYDELRSFVQKSSLRGATLLPVVNGLFDRNYEENAVKDKKDCIKVDSAYLSLLGFCTTDTWETLFTSAFLDIGFINRLWIVPGEAEKKDFNPELIPPHKKLKLKIKFQRLLETYPDNQSTLIEISHAGDVELNNWYHSYENTEFTRRLDDYGRRLLLIMAISENKREIDEDMALRVITLLEWQRKVRELFQPGIYTSTMAQLENSIRKAVEKNQPITEKLLFNRIHADRFDTWHVTHALEGLVKNGELKRVFKGRFPAYVMGNT